MNWPLQIATQEIQISEKSTSSSAVTSVPSFIATSHLKTASVKVDNPDEMWMLHSK